MDNRKGFQVTSTTIRFAFIAAVSLLAAADPALAGVTPTPGPMIGAGLPALALFGAGSWLLHAKASAE
jgi:hypothetical protein